MTLEIKTYSTEFVYKPHHKNLVFKNDEVKIAIHWFYKDFLRMDEGKETIICRPYVFPFKNREFKLSTVFNGHLHKLAHDALTFAKKRHIYYVKIKFQYDVKFEEGKIPMFTRIHDVYFTTDVVSTFRKEMNSRPEYDYVNFFANHPVDSSKLIIPKKLDADSKEMKIEYGL